MKFEYDILKFNLKYRDHQGVEQSLEIDYLKLEGCPGCGHVPTPDEIVYESLVDVANEICLNYQYLKFKIENQATAGLRKEHKL